MDSCSVSDLEATDSCPVADFEAMDSYSQEI
jgi:hypothetical protein